MDDLFNNRNSVEPENNVEPDSPVTVPEDTGTAPHADDGLTPDTDVQIPQTDAQSQNAEVQTSTYDAQTHNADVQTSPADVQSPDADAQTPPVDESVRHADTRTQSGTTYSWVNPKLRGTQEQDNAQSGSNPWNSQSDGNYWHYNSQQNHSRQTSGGYNAGSRNSGYNAGNTNTGYNAGSRNSGYNAGNANTGYNAGSRNSGYNAGNANTGYNAGNQNNGYNAGNAAGGHQTGDPTARKSRKNLNRGNTSGPKTTGGKWAVLIAMALVFGLIAGLVMYGVNYAANSVRPVPSAETESRQIPSTKEESNASHADTDTSGTRNSSGRTATAQTATVADVAEEAMPALVTISTMSVQEMQSFFGGRQQYTVEGAGTGVIIGKNDTELLIATNNHVIEGATEVSIGFVDESVISANIKGTDADNDLAVVAVNLSDIPDETLDAIKIIAVGDSDALVLGEQVVAIGNALGYGQSVTSGYVSGLNRSLTFSDGTNTFVSDGLIQTDAAINSGNSGGALLNMNGELIGINEAKSSSTSSGATVDNMGYSIPVSKAMPILNELMNEETKTIYSADEQGYLGVTCADVTADYSQVYNMPEGVCFTSVLEDSPAAQAGAIKGDVLVEVNGKSITTYTALTQELQYYAAGDVIELTVMRANNGNYESQTLTVTLGTKDAISSLQESSTEDTEEEVEESTEDSAPERPSEPEDRSDDAPEQRDSGMFDEQDLFDRLFGDD